MPTLIKPRRGSIMIMVVALLVLLALMGTAWIATTRFDRGSSAANLTNTQTDANMEGLKNRAVTALDLSEQTGYDIGLNAASYHYFRPRSSSYCPGESNGQGYFYSPFTSIAPAGNGTRRDLAVGLYLSSRVPQCDDPTAVPPIVYWPWISAPLLPTPINAPLAFGQTPNLFGSPFVGPDLTNRNFVQTLNVRQGLRPTYCAFMVNGQPTVFPALEVEQRARQPSHLGRRYRWRWTRRRRSLGCAQRSGQRCFRSDGWRHVVLRRPRG